MPNWVLCGFIVTGDVAEVDRFKAKMVTERLDDRGDPHADISQCEMVPFLDFGAIIPLPAELANRTTRRFADFGGSVPNEMSFEAWALHHWGTKWDAQSLRVNRDEPGKFSFQFDTAWMFPEPVFRALAKEFPTLVFEGSAIDESDAFAYRGQFNGDDEWKEVDPEGYWTVLFDGAEDDDDGPADLQDQTWRNLTEEDIAEIRRS